jgi:hypothetical protein
MLTKDCYLFSKELKKGRIFDEDALKFLETILCLKNTGMPIKDIKEVPWWKKILGSILEVVEVFIAPTEGVISVVLLSIKLLLMAVYFY